MRLLSNCKTVFTTTGNPENNWQIEIRAYLIKLNGYGCRNEQYYSKIFSGLKYRHNPISISTTVCLAVGFCDCEKRVMRAPWESTVAPPLSEVIRARPVRISEFNSIIRILLSTEKQ